MKMMRPALPGPMAVETAIKQRRTVRSFRQDKAITRQQLSNILWAAQGITEEGGFKRAAPSGGALYPADVYIVAGYNGVNRMNSGVYHYQQGDHSLQKVADGDRRVEVATAALGQMWMTSAPVLFVITAQYARITGKYGNRGIRYALIEIGHIGQNIFLECQALGLSAGIVGAFRDREVAQALGGDKRHEPLIIMPVGWQD